MCVSPLTVRLKNSYRSGSIQVPCGHCIECLKDYQNNWCVRLYYQALESKAVTFCTLTYNNDSVPYIVDTDTGEMNLSVCVRHIQNALKRYRINNMRSDNAKPFKYFICSEYGPHTFRPHYHCLFFGLSKDDLLPFLKDWQSKYGFTTAKDVTYTTDSLANVSRYVSKYCSKGVFENPRAKNGIVRPTFRVVSKGMGISYVTRNKAWHLSCPTSIKKSVQYKKLTTDVDPLTNQAVKYFKVYSKWSPEYLAIITDKMLVDVGGYNYKMPRYYKDKIYGTKTCLSFQMSDFLFEKYSNLYFEKLRQIQAERACDFATAVRIADIEETADARQRATLIERRLKRFYNKSQF